MVLETVLGLGLEAVGSSHLMVRSTPLAAGVSPPVVVALALPVARSSPVGVESSTEPFPLPAEVFSVESSPVVADSSPVVAESLSAAVESSPVVADSSPGSSPVAAESIP